MPGNARDVRSIRSLSKARGRLDSAPVLCRLLLEANLYWLVQNYLRVHRLAYPGERGALEYLE